MQNAEFIVFTAIVYAVVVSFNICSIESCELFKHVAAQSIDICLIKKHAIQAVDQSIVLFRGNVIASQSNRNEKQRTNPMAL